MTDEPKDNPTPADDTPGDGNGNAERNADSNGPVERPQQAQISVKNGISAVWLVPLIALIFGLYLGVKAYLEQGIIIHINFPTAEGITPGKTEVRYKGLIVGIVKDVSMADNLKRVDVTVEMTPQTADYLTENAQFWLVSAEISLSGVKGLDTLMSGNYIRLQEGDQSLAARRDFVALESPPLLPDSAPELHIRLKAKELGSIRDGTKIFYRKIPVGEVRSHSLNPDGQGVTFEAYIDEKYAHLVYNNTRFWNISGVSLEGDITNLKLKLDSLESLLIGGIAMGVPEQLEAGGAASRGDRFTLHADYEAAQVGIPIKLYFEFGTGINDDMPILFEGITMGRIHRYTIELNRRQIIAEAEFDPRYDEYLNDKSQFFLVKPRVSLSGIENLETLTKGQYVSLRPSTHGIPVAKFTVRNGAPPIAEDGPGLHLVLSANSAASLSPGTPVLYHQLDVGSVQTIKLNPGEFPRFNVKIHIRPEYAHLVNRESRFWNARGVAIKGGVQSFEIRTESIASILQGGIAFTTPGPLPPTETAALRAQNGDRFTLYEDEEDSQINTRIQVHFDSGEGLREGMPVKYQDQKIGEVDSLSFATGSRAGLSNISANIRLFDWARSLIRNDTSIWLVKAKVGLTDIKNVDALVLGTYLEILPGTGRVTQRLTARQHPAKSRSRPRGLNLVLRGDHLGSVKEGHPISYRQIKVGDVISKDLSADANHVLVYINIYEEYVNLVKSDSVFWNASGIKVDAGLFSGVKINTESLETLITGGIAFATPPKHPQQENVGQGHEFTIHDKSRDTWLRWKPGIPLRN